MAANTARDVVVYPMFNRGTRSGMPFRWRYRMVATGRVKSFATPEQALAYVGSHFPDLKVDVSAIPTF